ncbi:MAG: GAF domain-containing protein [Pseudolabrys sp.]
MSTIDALRQLCAQVETLAPGAAAGLTIVNGARTHIERAIFPSLPDGFSTALTDVPLEPSSFGSCVKAIATGKTITCVDVEGDTVFDRQWRQVCLSYGLKAVQSRPVFISGEARGTFVLAYRDAKPESEWDDALMKFAADAAGRNLSVPETA